MEGVLEGEEAVLDETLRRKKACRRERKKERRYNGYEFILVSFSKDRNILTKDISIPFFLGEGRGKESQ